MNFLPISLNIENKHILVVGGGKVAFQKIKNLLPFTKKITVVAPEIREEISTLENIVIIKSLYKTEYLKDMFLVYACTNHPETNQRILADAEKQNILCNRTDKAEESGFISSAIVETDSMLLALNSKRKEVKKTVSLKKELKAFIHEREQLETVKEESKGKVYLVGFGSGNPDLLTVKGKKLLTIADVIFYDDLLDADALNQYPGKKIYVGKRRNNHSKEQSEINEILLQSAQQGNMVVRLKGGDPLIFGRGGEEKMYLEEHGIQVEIVPGISSAIAAAAYGDIPLTHRGISSSVAFGTAHAKNSYKILESDTSVYYMGAKNIRQIAQKYLEKGYPGSYPVGLIYNASMPDQEVTKTTISELLESNMEIKSPVISIFGYTVDYRSFSQSKEEI